MCTESPRAVVMSSWRMAVAAVLALGPLYGMAPLAAEQAPATTGERVSVAAATSPDREAPQPQETPEGTVRELYADETFFRVRNAFPPPLVQRFSCCFTPELLKHFEAHNEDVDRWFEQNQDENLKLPMSEGPIFLSNYEGADTYSVGQAKVDGTRAEVPVTFSYTYGGDIFRWADVAILRLVDGAWLLDDIRFDPARWDNYTLRQRVGLDE